MVAGLVVALHVLRLLVRALLLVDRLAQLHRDLLAAGPQPLDGQVALRERGLHPDVLARGLRVGLHLHLRPAQSHVGVLLGAPRHRRSLVRGVDVALQLSDARLEVLDGAGVRLAVGFRLGNRLGQRHFHLRQFPLELRDDVLRRDPRAPLQVVGHARLLGGRQRVVDLGLHVDARLLAGARTLR